ncbi:MAG: hypothetical protein ED557_13955 [Balneola sp.]|nr:MAG: hypothetical protein ED557_13955 [Balneola sp.]
MKQLLVTIIFIGIGTIEINAQQNTVRRVNQIDYSYEVNEDIRELRNFENKLDRFSYALMVEDNWQAKKVKDRILNDMQREIRQTRRELDRLDRSWNNYSKRNYSEYRTRRGGIQSKNRGRYQNYEVRLLMDRLEDQIWIKNRFEETYLTGRRRALVNKKKHRRLMYEFRDIMREEIEFERGHRDRRG